MIMIENLTLEGERYIGEFKANLKDDSISHTYISEMSSWHEGAALIEDRKTGKKYFFVLDTHHFHFYSRDDYSLERCILDHSVRSGWGEYFKPKVVDGMFKKIIDLGLADIVSKIEVSKDKIPTITPEGLCLNQLVKLGYCHEDDGQITLGLGIDLRDSIKTA